MGQKVSPKGMRIGVNKEWDAQWYADKKSFSEYLIEDHKIREYIKKKYYDMSLSRIAISRISSVGVLTISVYTSKPSLIIGKNGAGVTQMENEVKKISKSKDVNINVFEVKRPDVDAQLVAENIAKELEDRKSFRRAMKSAIGRAMRAGAKGVKVMVSGRLDGAEIARSEKYHEGSIPLQTLRADIDYGFAQAKTTFGIIGVKTWVYKGEILGKTAVTGEGGNA